PIDQRSIEAIWSNTDSRQVRYQREDGGAYDGYGLYHFGTGLSESEQGLADFQRGNGLLRQAAEGAPKSGYHEGEYPEQGRRNAEARDLVLGENNLSTAKGFNSDAEAAGYVFWDGKLQERKALAARLEQSAYERSRRESLDDFLTLKDVDLGK